MTIHRDGQFNSISRAIAGGEVLYNGIQLPVQWPPLDIELYEGAQEVGNLISREPLPVPYITSPPGSRIVRTAAGVGGRQLWAVDDWLVKYRGPNVSRVWGTLTRVGTVLEVDPSGRAHEEFDPGEFATMPFDGGINYDASAGLFKAHYWAGPEFTGYAESATGAPGSYTFPNLGVFGSTNVCKRWNDLATGHDSDTVWLDLDEADPNKRWKMAATRFDPGVSWHQDIHYSADGKTWGAKVAQTGQIIDRTTVHRNPFRGKWVWSIRQMLGPQSNPRHRVYWEQNSFDTGFWTHGLNYTYPQVPTQPAIWARMTSADPSRHDVTNPALDVDAGGTPGVASPTEMYSLSACAYESLMVFAIAKYDGGPVYLGRPKFNEIQLATSRDGFHYVVAKDRLPWIPMSTTPQDALWGNVQPISPVIMVDEDECVMHVSGRTGVPGQNLNSGQCQAVQFRFRRDGLAGWRFADGVEDEVRTERVRWYSGTKLYANWEPSGIDGSPQLRAEIRNEVTGAVYSGFARANSGVLSGDTTWSEITFTGGSLAPLQGEPIELRFYGRGGTCWSWGITDNAGAAGGYIHQGRP